MKLSFAAFLLSCGSQLLSAAGAPGTGTVRGGIKTPLKQLEHLDMVAIHKEDSTAGSKKPTRFAITQEIDPVSPNHHDDGQWEMVVQETENGSTTRKVWRYAIQADPSNTKSMAFGFERFHLPEGAKLFIVNVEDQNQVLGPFTSAHNSDRNSFTTPPFEGVRHAVMELDLNGADTEGDVELILSQIHVGYKEISQMLRRSAAERRLQRTEECQVDVACPEGDGWTDEINAVGVVVINYSLLCSGTMLNNAAEDRTPYFITANHCVATDDQAATVRVFWNYELDTCNPDPRPNIYTQFPYTEGASLLTTYEDTDTSLLLLDSVPPADANVGYAGWDRSGERATGVTCIHHPSGSEKRIAISDGSTNFTVGSFQYDDDPDNGTYVHVIGWDKGAVEAGSSGSGLFDSAHRLIGVYSGGFSGCLPSPGLWGSAWYGRFSVSWDNSDMSTYLDPQNSGMETLDSLPAATASPTSNPTASPTTSPTGSPSTSPTGSPSTSPTGSPTSSPSIEPCSTHSDCPDHDQSFGYFCDPSLQICLEKRADWVPDSCSANTDAMCQSGICVDTVCQPCRKINKNDVCGVNQYCARRKKGHKCVADKVISARCVSNQQCLSGQCTKVGSFGFCTIQV